jgi:hypothetical protein
MNTNLLDLNNDILEIIGDYVKRGNERRLDTKDSFEVTDFYQKNLKEKNKFNKYEINELLFCYFFKTGCTHGSHPGYLARVARTRKKGF